MSIEQLLILLIGFVLSIGVVKLSAQLAYKQRVSWGDAFVQWILLIVLAFLAGIIMKFLQLGSIFSNLFNAIG